MLLSALQGLSQNTLFDDTRVSSVCVEISPDSLDWILKNVKSDRYFGARFIYDDGTRRDTIENAGFRLRGNTSRYSKKKSFKISFNEFTPGRRYQGVKKINLNGEHNDPTLIREKLFYDLWKKAGMPERRTSFVRLYVNGTYFGLYTNLEEFDKDWLKKVFGENDGNLFKCTYPSDLVWRGENPSGYKNLMSSTVTGGRVYDLQTNEAADDYSGLIRLIGTLDKPGDGAFFDNINRIIDVNLVLKAFALDVATGNWDDYMYNKNNYFLYQGPDNGRFRFITYDPDNTFGVDWMKQNWATRNCLSWFKENEPRPLATALLAVPDFYDRYTRYLDTIARLVIKPDIVFPYIDRLLNLVAAPALQDTYRTLDYGYTTDDFFRGFTGTVDGHTPFGIKPFLEQRYRSIVEQLKTVGAVEYNLNGNQAPVVFPNPAPGYLSVVVPSGVTIKEITVSSVSGSVLIHQADNENKNRANLSLQGIAPGVYLVVVKTSLGCYPTRIVNAGYR